MDAVTTAGTAEERLTLVVAEIGVPMQTVRKWHYRQTVPKGWTLDRRCRQLLDVVLSRPVCLGVRTEDRGTAYHHGSAVRIVEASGSKSVMLRLTIDISVGMRVRDFDEVTRARLSYEELTPKLPCPAPMLKLIQDQYGPN